MNKMKNNIVMVVAAHPDDEVLGCGGAIAKHSAQGDEVHVVFLADGETSRLSATEQDQLDREQAAKKAGGILGVKSHHFLKLPDNRLDSLPLLEVIRPLEDRINSIKPAIVYTHHAGDLNVDHRAAYQSVLTACRPQPYASVKQIFTFEVLSSTEWSGSDMQPFVPNTYMDISRYLEQKLDALNAYKKEMKPAPNSRCVAHVKSLALHRGYTVGMNFAESFMLIRNII